jgi:glutathione S-transferase
LLEGAAVSQLQFVDMATARTARGVRLLVSGIIPSPWSEAAKGLFHARGIPALAVRYRRGDQELFEWTGARNVPVVLHDDEPPRTGWAEILALAERLPGGAPLCPADPEARVRMYGLINELAGEGGMSWNGRLLMIDASLTSGGAQGFPLPVAQYLAPRYGHTPGCAAAARAAVVSRLALFERELARRHAAGHRYLLGPALTAVDIYLATFLTPVVGVSEADCPAMRPDLRPAFDVLREVIGPDLPPSLIAHRAFIYERHLPWPIAL